jgi:lysophospholipid acyltransferase (LPLAT)-like uncharacterized protein
MPGKPPEFTRRQRLIIFFASWVGWVMIGLLNATLRLRVVGGEELDSFRAEKRPVILACWHNQIFSATWLYRHEGIAVITSQHFDGEYIARIIERYGFKAVRGSSTRGGARAVLEVRKHVAEGRMIGIMVDGPKGPRYQAKPGTLFLSRMTGAPIVPFHIEVENRWELKSWDRFRIPKPFSRAVMRVGNPIWVTSPKDERLESLQEELERLARECEADLGGTRA